MLKDNDLVFEILKQIQAGQVRIERKVDELTARMASAELQLVGLRTDVTSLTIRMDGFDKRLERIERRLDLVEE